MADKPTDPKPADTPGSSKTSRSRSPAQRDPDREVKDGARRAAEIARERARAEASNLVLKGEQPLQRQPAIDSAAIAQRERTRLAHLAAQRWRESGVPSRHAAVSKLRHTADGRAGEVYRELVDRVDEGVLAALIGPRGTGKTQIAVWVIAQSIRRGHSARYLRAAEMYRGIRAGFDSAGGEQAMIDRLCGCQVLVIDELHERADTPYERRTLTEVIDRRYADCRATIVIANVVASELASILGDSALSRMHEDGATYVCDWGSWRERMTDDMRSARRQQAEGRRQIAARLAVDEQTPGEGDA